MKLFVRLIESTAKKPQLYILLAALIVFNILMNAPGLPTSTPSMQEISPSFTPFDLQYKGYSPEAFTNDLDKLGEKGRRIYRNFMLCDILFPAIYALFFGSVIFRVFRKKRNGLQWLFLIPIFTGFMDYIENIFIAIAFAGYPSGTPLPVTLASTATQVKMFFNILLILSLLLTLGTWIATLMKKQK